MSTQLKLPNDALLAYERLRCALYRVEALMLPAVEYLATGRVQTPQRSDFPWMREAALSLDQLLKRDVQRIEAGVYPVDVLFPQSPLRHFARFPELFREGFALNRRRAKKDAKSFAPEAQDYLKDVPSYYRRNFHFQPDGYLSEKSARLYDHQVELLFSGGADPMRRLIIEPMKKHFNQSDGEGLTFLETGAGTGRATRFVRLAFPKARIVAVDLSAPYLKRARSELAGFSRVDFVEAAGEELPFQDSLFDAAYSVFLFHELPMEARKSLIAETLRVLKPGGFFGLVDSIQSGDRREFDSALDQFPGQLHEPFYKNYSMHPMETVAEESGVENLATEIGFFSKCVSGGKASAAGTGFAVARKKGRRAGT